MTVKDLMKVCVIPDDKFKICDDKYSHIFTKDDIVLDDGLMSREIDYIYTVLDNDCISIILVNY